MIILPKKQTEKKKGGPGIGIFGSVTKAFNSDILPRLKFGLDGRLPPKAKYILKTSPEFPTRS